jgi:hypothetical protein
VRVRALIPEARSREKESIMDSHVSGPSDEFIPSPPTRYALLAKDVMEALKALMADVPKLDQSERRSAAFIRTHIGIPFPFVMGTAAAVERIPVLERLNQMDVVAAWGAHHLIEAFRLVTMRLIMVTEELQTLLDTRQANATAEALNVYAIAQALLRRDFDQDLARYVKTSKLKLGRRGRPRKKKRSATDAAAAAEKKQPLRRRRTRRPLGARLKRRVDRKKK